VGCDYLNGLLTYISVIFVDQTRSFIKAESGGEISAISTIVIRGATDNYMDDIERAVDDGVNTFKGLTKV